MRIGVKGSAKRIGLIAGSGQFPLIFSRAAREKGYDIFAAAYRTEADPHLEDLVDEIEWVHLGQFNRLINFFKRSRVTELVMLGGIRKTKLFTDVKPDSKAILFMAGMRDTHDDRVLRGFADLLEKEGLHIRPSTMLLPDILASTGCWTKRKPTRSEKKDIDLGWTLAKKIGSLDIGQCLVVGGGSVLAVEAIDGTDATIMRGGKLGKGNAVVVKVCKPNQDVRFDIPSVGAQTVQTMKDAGAKVLAIEAGKTVVFDREEMVSLANACRISIIALDETDMASKGIIFRQD
jgi:DUF1009 family protein